jgi:hypothetical protein
MVMRTRSLAVIAALLAFAAACINPAAASAAPPALSAPDRVVTLPSGELVALYGPPGAPTGFGPPPGVTWPTTDPVVGATMDGHLYAIPVSALPTLAGHLDNYDLSRLAGGPAAPAANSTAVTPTTSGGSGSHNFWTLTVNPVPAPGAITFFALIQLENVDDAGKYATTTGVGPQGESFSVPQGHYSLVAVFFGLENGQLVNRTVVNPEFTVDAPSAITADASTATVEPSASVSRPANLSVETMNLTRTAAKNGGIGIFSNSPGGAFKLLVNPTAQVHVGSLHYDTYWHFDSQDAGASYTYDLDFPADGAIPAAQDHPANDSTLAAIDAHYASEVPGQTAGVGRGLVDRAGLSPMSFTLLEPITVPAERTEYVTGGPDVHWQAAEVRLGDTFEDWFTDAVRTYPPGGQVTATWMRQPLVPGVAQFAQPWFAPLVCPACRQGDNLNLIIEPYADNGGHVAVQPTSTSTAGDVATGSFELSSGATVLASGRYPDGLRIPIPHVAAQYQLRYDVSRSAPWWNLSTSTHTEWTFSSVPNNANLPPGWFCDTSAATTCNVLPLLFANYQLPTDDTGRESAGPVTADINVHHLQGAAQPGIDAVTVRVSFDDEQTWQHAAVTATGAGQYHVSYTNPSGAATASLWLTAHDSQGNTLSQVIHRAYAITTS